MQRRGYILIQTISREQIGGDTESTIKQILTKEQGLDTIKEANNVAVNTLKQYYGEDKPEQIKGLFAIAQGV